MLGQYLAIRLVFRLFVAPKKSVPAIKSIIRSAHGTQDDEQQVSPAYSLDGDNDE